MKFLLMSACALAFAAPKAAQTAPNAQAHAHAGHAQHHATQPGTQPAAHAEHAQHQGHGGSGVDHSKHANCCGDANGNGRMDCCEGAQAAQRLCCEEHAAGGQPQSARPAPSN